MSQPPLRFGLVGAGAIAQAYLQAFTASKLAELVAVADGRPAAARAMAERLGCPAYSDHLELLESTACDAVVVCTPPASHAEISVTALQRGVSVLCEKPFCLSTASARRMIQAAERSGALLTMASKFRYLEDVIQAKSIVTSGSLGEVVLFENTFASRVEMRGRWNSDPEISGGGVLIDNGTHSVDLIRYFLGPIAQVLAVEGRRVQGLAVEDTVRLFVRSVDGVMGSIDLSWSLNKEVESFIDIYGSQGTVRVGWRRSKYRRSGSPGWTVFGKGYQKIEAFRRQIDNFVRAIRGDEPLLIDAGDALASVEVIEAAYESLRNSRWTPVSNSQHQPTVRATPA